MKKKVTKAAVAVTEKVQAAKKTEKKVAPAAKKTEVKKVEVKKVASAAKKAEVKKAVPAKKAAPAVKKAAPAKKVEVKKAAPAVKKAAPVAKKTEVKKAAPAKKAAEPVKKAVPVAKKAEVKKAAEPVKKAAPAKKAAEPVKKAAEPVKKAAPVKKAIPAVKKAEVKKVEPVEHIVRHKKLRLNKKTKKYYTNLLLDLRRVFSEQVEFHKEDALSSKKDSAGERAGMATHMADLGSDNFRHDLELSLMSDEGDVLEMIDEALQRIENSEYGICLECGCEINPQRLEAKPYARFCVKCKSAFEKLEDPRRRHR